MKRPRPEGIDWVGIALLATLLIVIAFPIAKFGPW